MRALIELFPMLAMLVVAAAVDLKHRRIPNWLTGSLALGGLVASATWTQPVVGPWLSLAGAATGLLINLPLFALRIRGGGDMKLFAAVGAWIGPIGIVAVFIVATVIGLVVAIVQALLQRRLRPVLANSASVAVGMAHGTSGGLELLDEDGDAKRHVPYAVPIGIAVLALVMWG